MADSNTNPNFTAALRGSLDSADNPSPLSEADPFSLEELWNRITGHLAAGLPEAIEESDLKAMVLRLRAQRLKWQQEQERKANAAPRRSPGKPTSVSSEIKRRSIEDLL